MLNQIKYYYYYFFSTSTQAVFITQAVNSTYHGKELPIAVQFPGEDVILTDFTFTYMAPAIVNSLSPIFANTV